MNKKSIVFSLLAGFVFVGIIASKPPGENKPVYKNLTVLSYKISEKDMDYVMETFSANLGVNCMFCHVANRDPKNFSIDYVSDKLENKRIAREMLRMSMRLNKKYFNKPLNSAMTTRGRIWCKTCHGGKPIPLLQYPKKS